MGQTLKPLKKRVIAWPWVVAGGGFLLLGILMALSFLIRSSSKPFIYQDAHKIPQAYTGLVLGARVYPSGRPSLILKDRLDAAILLYEQKKITRILLSGDHGQKHYDEVNHMKNYLLNQNIPGKDIFLDHAGFDTYNSLFRAREVFEVKDLIIITQTFHLSRALYIARGLGLTAYGFAADKRLYAKAAAYEIRELAARLKAFLELNFRAAPRFLGKRIPITGESKASWD